MSYALEGSILEVCNCKVLCPCWIGEDPDPGTCDAVVAYHIDSGNINGVDVSGRTFAEIVHIPGNVLQGNWKTYQVVDDGASAEQRQALIDAFSGKLGGPLADFAAMTGEILGIESAPITYALHEGKGTLRIGSMVEAEMTPYVGSTGKTTTLNDSVFSSIPGAPAWVSKASKYVRRTSSVGLKDIDLKDHNAIQGAFRFEAN